MVAGSSPDGGRSQAISNGVRNTIRSIKEIVGDHSESDIYEVLRETNMDPNETTQRLLDEVPFHEVRRRRDRKKENTGHNGTNTNTNESKIQNQNRSERKIQNETKTELKHQNEYKTEPRQYENRTEHQNNNNYYNNNYYYNNNNNGERRIEYKRQNEIIKTEYYNNNFIKTERPWEKNGYVYNNTRIIRGGYFRTGRGGFIKNSIPGPVKEYRIVRDNRNKPKSEEPNTQILISDNINTSSKQESTLLSPTIELIKSKKESTAEICSSSDPIHVSKGPIRREVGVVGLRKPNPNPNPNPNFGTENYNRQHHLRPNSRGNNRINTNSLPLTSLNQYTGKAQQVNMEWRPKSSQSPRNGPELTLTGQQNQSTDAVTNLSENVAKCKISEDLHVIIPQHLRVPESEQTRLVFGSFDSPKNDTLSMVGPANENLASGGEHNNNSNNNNNNNNEVINEAQVRENSDEAGPQDVISDDVSPYESTLPHDLQDNSTDLQNFKEFDPHSRYDMQFLGKENSVTQETTVISTEAMSVGPSIQIPVHPIPLQHQIQQLNNNNNLLQVPQMYPQLQQFNYLPYRHVFSPVYMPQQIPVPNYQNTPAAAYPQNTPSYPQNTPAYPPPPIPSPVPNYLLMPGTGTGTVPATGVKYSTNQFKPVFSTNGYANYPNPNGYPGLIEDASRIKYKDINNINNNNALYAPNLHVEASDIWVQTPREMPNSTFYNIQSQPATPTYMTHNGPASYTATQQPPQLQYPPPLHQTGQPGSMALLPPPPPPGPLGLNGLGAPAGPFQGNHPLGHLGWTAANF